MGVRVGVVKNGRAMAFEYVNKGKLVDRESMAAHCETSARIPTVAICAIKRFRI
jgi:hypothetical protein